MLDLSLLGKKPKSVKDYLLLMLIEDYPLKTKALYNELRKKYAFSVTYQGVHKAVTQLVEDGILFRAENGYQLNEHWIQQIKLFITLLESNYEKSEQSSRKKLHEMKHDGDSRILTVNNFCEALSLQKLIRLRFQEKYASLEPEKKPLRITHLHHITCFVLHIADTHEGYTDSKSWCPNYYLIEGNSPVDKESVQLVHSYPIPRRLEKFVLGATLLEGCHTALYDDMIIRIYLPKALKKKMEYFYNKANSINNFDSLNFFKEVIIFPARIKVILYKDKELARLITNNTLEYVKIKEVS